MAASDPALRGGAPPGVLSLSPSIFNMADSLTLGYLCFSTLLIVACRGNVASWRSLLPVHLAMMAAIAVLAVARQRRVPVLVAAAEWYPTLIFLFFFEEIGLIVHAIHPGWFDRYLIDADLALFGVHPTVWIERFNGYWMTEYMQLAYTSYYLLTIGFAARLWFGGRRGEFAALIEATCVAYYLCYVIYVLFPVESPYHTLRHLQQADLAGGPVTALIDFIERHGRVHGGAFPSAHVAGSMVVLFSAFRFERKIGWRLLPLVLSICVATVYGRYHYVVDIFAGIAVAAAGCLAAWSLFGKRARSYSPQLSQYISPKPPM